MKLLNKQPKAFKGKLLTALRTRIEFGDALLFWYVLVFVRQYLWLIGNNFLAWSLSVPLAAAVWYMYTSTKQCPAKRFGRSFWLLVGLPLVAAYLLRVAFPDHSYDVLTYHLLHSERTLSGPLFITGDFFPSPVPFNPVPDTLAGISRFLLGFRLGTVINLFAMVWAAQVADKILQPFVNRSWPRAACVLLVVLAENFFFEISTYMVDILALPLMLEATLLTLRADEAENQRTNFVHVALLLGASVAFKLTNLAVALPLGIICVYRAVTGSERTTPRRLATTAMLALASFFAPLIPFTIYIFQVTGNPTFPIANVFFKSPYWPTHGGWDYRWGPQNFRETIAWPVLIWFRPERHSELAVYSGRLSLGFVVALLGLVLVWRNARTRALCFILILSSLLWSAAATGYSRYGLYQEMLAGITIVAVACALMGKVSESMLSWRTGVASLCFMALMAQAALACRYTLKYEWGSRPTAINNMSIYGKEAQLMLRDRSLVRFLPENERALIADVQVWLETCPKSTGFEVLLSPRVPIIAARQPEYFFTRESRKRFIHYVEQSAGQRMFSLCLNDELPTARKSIAARGLEMGRVTPVEIPFFSASDRIGMMLIEVLLPQEPAARSSFESSWMNAAFPDADYREQIIALDAPAVIKPGEKVTIRFTVKNMGHSTWPAVGNKQGRYQVNIGDRWLDVAGKVVINGADGRSVMKGDLPPGAEMELQMAVTAPANPGDYTLEVDMVHEEVTWFYERGATPLHLRVRVAP